MLVFAFGTQCNSFQEEAMGCLVGPMQYVRAAMTKDTIVAIVMSHNWKLNTRSKESFNL